MSVSTPVKVYQDPVVPARCPVTTCSRDTQTDESLLEALIQERQSSESCGVESLDSGRGSTLSLTDLSDLTSGKTVALLALYSLFLLYVF